MGELILASALGRGAIMFVINKFTAPKRDSFLLHALTYKRCRSWCYGMAIN